jgi:polysaccharide biosynthesis protein PslH
MSRLLVLTSRLPFPPREGHQLRSWHLLKALASRHEVTLLSFRRDEDVIAETEPMRAILAGLETFPIPAEHSRRALAVALAKSQLTREPFVAAKYRSQALRERVKQLARQSDLVHFDMLPLMACADVVPAGVPVAYNAHNVEHLLLDKRVDIESRPLVRRFLRGQSPRLRAFERSACERADLVLSCSDADAMALKELSPSADVHVVPNGVDLDANQPAPPGTTIKPQLVFVGQMGWFPNRDGVDWFLREIFPRILAERPDVEFVLVGKAEGLVVPPELAHRVRIAGFVPDLRPLVHEAAVYVVPLRAGSGTRLKVLEAMALGKAIVTTHIGSEGIALEHDVSAVYADEADAFAAATLALLDDPQRAQRLGAQARTAAVAHYGWDAIGRDMLARYDALLAAAKRV